MSPVSLPSVNSPTLDKLALDNFIRQPVSESMIQYLASATLMTIKCDPVKQSPGQSEPHLLVAEPTITSLSVFIRTLVKRSNVQTPTLMTSLVYLARLRDRLPPSAVGMSCTCHRIFLAALIIAAKNLNDSSPKNKYWARYTAGLFTVADVNLMEIQMLYLLDWDMRVTNRDLYMHLNPFLAPIKDGLLASKSPSHCDFPMSPQSLTSSPTTYSGMSASSSIRPLRVKPRPLTPPELSASSSLDSLSSVESSYVHTPVEIRANSRFGGENAKSSQKSNYADNCNNLTSSMLDPRAMMHSDLTVRP